MTHSDHLYHKLAEGALKLIDVLLDEETIAAAPLNQRVAALKVLLDAMLKLAPDASTSDDGVIRIEYRDPDGSTHGTPQWVRTHPNPPESIGSHRLWEIFEQVEDEAVE